MRERGGAYRVLVGKHEGKRNTKEREYLEDLDLGGRLLKWILS
jgi:hypothetical protein